MNKSTKTPALISALVVSYLLMAPNSFAQERTTPTPQPSLYNNLTAAAAWKQTAAEYKALYHQGFNIARDRIDQAIKSHKRTGKPLAIITDMDDTIFDASKYWGYLIEHNQDFFDDSIWDQWIPTNQITATPGSVELLNYAKSKGVAVFYVSSRDQGEKTFEYGLGNLVANGFPDADAEHVTILRDSSNKEPKQKEISERFDVVVYLGDNLNDFQRKYYVKDTAERAKLMTEDQAQFGRTFILMPNPTDGHWMRAIFGNSEPPANDENRKIFKKAATQSVYQPAP